MTTKQITNDDLVHDLMNYSPYGALCQAFIIQAIRDKCKNVIESQEALRKYHAKQRANGKIPLINEEAWIGLAKDISERMDYFYENQKLK